MNNMKYLIFLFCAIALPSLSHQEGLEVFSKEVKCLGELINRSRISIMTNSPLLRVSLPDIGTGDREAGEKDRSH